MGIRLDLRNPIQVPMKHLHPIPVPGAQRDGDPAPLRKLYCPHYAACLDVAAREGWDDFSCMQCALSKDAPVASAAAMAQDRPGPRE